MARMRARSRLLPIVALLGLFLQLPAHADRAAETRDKLKELRTRIEAVRKDLAAERQRHDRASDALADTEKRIGRVAGRIGTLDGRIQDTRQRLDHLSDRRKELHRQLAAHRETLADQLRAAYRLGRQPALRLVLRQDDPAALARALGYYGYFNRARLHAIDHARDLLQSLHEVRTRTEAARKDLQADRAELARQRSALESARAKRQELVASLGRSIASKGRQLESMEASRKRLRDLLAKLGSVLDDIPAAPLEERPFPTRRGKLQWPVDGSLRARFGASRASGRMKWQGIVINAPAGRRVHAVYYGRVVFADWLSGFGQLIIIDHLDGYLSLYGYNRQLLRTTGDWVRPGDPIATVGDSGAQASTGLYFEIRRKGQPVNPLAWLGSQ